MFSPAFHQLAQTVEALAALVGRSSSECTVAMLLLVSVIAAATALAVRARTHRP